MNQVAVGRLYRTTGSPKVLVNGLWPPAVVTRVKVVPPSLETDTPEIVAGGGASRIVVGDDHLEGVIWISRSVCLRLDNVRRGLGAGDQVDVRGAKQGPQHFLDIVEG